MSWFVVKMAVRGAEGVLIIAPDPSVSSYCNRKIGNISLEPSVHATPAMVDKSVAYASSGWGGGVFRLAQGSRPRWGLLGI